MKNWIKRNNLGIIVVTLVIPMHMAQRAGIRMGVITHWSRMTTHFINIESETLGGKVLLVGTCGASRLD